MENEIQQKLKEQEEKLDKIYASVEKTRKYFLGIIWLSILMVILPIIGMLFIVPTLLNSYSNLFNGLI